MWIVKWWYRVLSAFAGLRRASTRAVTMPPGDHDSGHEDAAATASPSARHTWRAHGSGRH
ncbi:MAG TPA: hypothetical protein PK379_01140 [Candidatus Hydrogenedentes bacterium]|nr:hypothetical protein [Candidatus Hydrogenedentota bacterium]HOK88607.1 hypothetical protein [Candidatus Hydrogenedentota bacterium]